MSSLLSDAQKDSLTADLAAVFDTFAETIVIHFDATVATVMSQANYSRYYKTTSGGKVKTPNHETIRAVIHYMTQQEVDELNSDGLGSQMKVPVQAGAIRIRLRQSEASKLTEVKKFEFDNRRFDPIGGRRLHGLFTRDRVDIIANPTEA